MKRFGPLFAIGVSALLAACSKNPTMLLPEGTSAHVERPLAIGAHRRTWMDAGLKNQDLLYVTNENGLVNVYRYQDHKLVGVLTKFQQPMGECVDASGNVYITDFQALKVYEYAHGAAKPVDTISDEYGPYACGVDPKTGNLAIANFGSGFRGGGNLEIYRHARGKPTLYSATCYDDDFTAVGYDAHGDLLAEASLNDSGSYSGSFYYLQPKSVSLTCLEMPGPTSYWNWYQVFSILWDGKYWMIDDYDLFRYSINIKAQYVDTIALGHSGDGSVGPVAIYRKAGTAYGTQLVGTGGYDYHEGSPYISYWNYPAGGSPIYQSTSKDLDAPYGVAISLRQ